jgi:hypothetical protein
MSVPCRSASCVQAPRLARQLRPGREERLKAGPSLEIKLEGTGDVDVKTEMIDEVPLFQGQTRSRG